MLQDPETQQPVKAGLGAKLLLAFCLCFQYQVCLRTN